MHPTPLDGFDDETQVVETNDKGGKASKLPYAMTSIDPRALLSLAAAMAKGNDRHGRDNWRLVNTDEHLNHALSHIYAWLAGDRQEDHLGHAFTRMMMAKAVETE
jgi:hypothetical protein